MNVRLIAITSYLGGENRTETSTLDSTASAAPTEALIEHAGRICYRSKGGGTPQATARFIRLRVEEGHESIIEHSSASFEISGISRSCSHQLVRHRLASFSQESQRYVDMSDPEWVIPPDVAADPEARAIWEAALCRIQDAYRQLRARGIKKQDARFLLPNAAATRLPTSRLIHAEPVLMPSGTAGPRPSSRSNQPATCSSSGRSRARIRQMAQAKAPLESWPRMGPRPSIHHPP